MNDAVLNAFWQMLCGFDGLVVDEKLRVATMRGLQQFIAADQRSHMRALPKFEPRVYRDYTLAVERIEDVLPELAPMHKVHWAETEEYRHEIALNPDYDRMIAYERAGNFILFTVRCNGELVGNCALYLSISTHTGKLIANEDTIFLAEKHRRGHLAPALIRYAEHCLALAGVTEVRTNTKTSRPRAGKLMRALGYTCAAEQMVKVLKGNV